MVTEILTVVFSVIFVVSLSYATFSRPNYSPFLVAAYIIIMILFFMFLVF